jgi:hypothetical protein
VCAQISDSGQVSLEKHIFISSFILNIRRQPQTLSPIVTHPLLCPKKTHETILQSNRGILLGEEPARRPQPGVVLILF